MPGIESCPCGRAAAYAACCGRYIDGGAAPPTAAALMRSRYTAYALGNENYLLQSWHASTRPTRLGLADASAVEWLGLTVRGGTRGAATDDAGTIEFVARYRRGGAIAQLHEDSRFVREHGRWFYVEGVTQPDAVGGSDKTGRNEPCPCGSGRKYQRCCGR